MSSDDASSFPIGASVSGTTASGDPFGGVVYSYDPRLHLCVLRAPGDIQNSHHVHVVRTKGAKVLHRVDATGDAARITEETLPAIDRGRQERRFEASVKAAQFVAGAFVVVVVVVVVVVLSKRIEINSARCFWFPNDVFLCVCLRFSLTLLFSLCTDHRDVLLILFFFLLLFR